MMIEKELFAYYWGAKHAQLDFLSEEPRFRLINTLTNQPDSWQTINELLVQRSKKPVLGGFEALPFEMLIMLISNLQTCRFIDNRCIIANHEFIKEKVFSNWEGKDVWRYIDSNRDFFPVDLLVMESSVIAIISPSYLETIVITSDDFVDFTPVNQWKRSDLSSRKRGHKLLGYFQIEMRDGIRLNTKVYLPMDYREGEKLPTILSRTPYDIENKTDHNVEFCDMGYAIVFQDVRGRGKSEGEFVPLCQEMDDGNDTLVWIENQPWFDGNIGSWGGSYGGYYQWPLAFNNRPSLKCIAPYVSGAGNFEDVMRRGGSFQIKMMPWLIMNSRKTREIDTELVRKLDFSIIGKHRPVVEISEILVGERVGYIEKLAENIPLTDFYMDDFVKYAPKTNIPAFLMSGPFDGNNCGNQWLWDMMEKNDYTGRKMIYGPWEHLLNAYRNKWEYQLSDDALVYNLEIEYIRFFDHYLKGINNGIDKEEAVRYYTLGENKWHTATAFPPKQASRVVYYLGSNNGSAHDDLSDGTLNLSQSHKSTFDSYIYDPQDAPEQIYAYKHIGGPPFMPVDYSRIESRNDVLTYTTEPFERSKNLLGSVEVNFYASSSAIDTDWVARLTIVREDGKSVRIADNILTARFREGFTQEKFLTPNQVYPYTITLPMCSHTIFKGEKLRLQICSAMKNLMVENPNTGANLFTYRWDETIIAHQSIYHSEEYPSHIVCHLLDINEYEV
jgi:uncharacterized protein